MMLSLPVSKTSSEKVQTSSGASTLGSSFQRISADVAALSVHPGDFRLPHLGDILLCFPFQEKLNRS